MIEPGTGKVEGEGWRRRARRGLDLSMEEA